LKGGLHGPEKVPYTSFKPGGVSFELSKAGAGIKKTKRGAEKKHLKKNTDDLFHWEDHQRKET